MSNFIDIQLKLLKEGAPIRITLPRRPNVAFTEDPPTTEEMRPPLITDKITFRHFGPDAVHALFQRLKPYLDVWIEERRMGDYVTAIRLVATFSKDSDRTAYALARINDPSALDYSKEMVLYSLCQRIISNVEEDL